jgi:ribulose-5-phosphate 4-epimerase/fuculose-1-phosphate aldolase
MSHEMEIIRLRKELSEFSRRAYDRGLVSGTGGNISVRIPGTDTALITPTGICLGDIDPEINLLMKIDGTVIENPCGLRPLQGDGFPSGGLSTAPRRGRGLPRPSSLCDGLL